ncbi:MAG: hypothetical protein AB7G76_04070 [Steroidobacteraceae bacterium]
MQRAALPERVVIVVQQESLRERPRIHKLGQILSDMGVDFEIWKFGLLEEKRAEGMVVRNVMDSGWRSRSAALRYVAWMWTVFRCARKQPRGTHFFAVGFDSGLPIALLANRSRSFVFDNIDNVSMSYRWPLGIKNVFQFFEEWVARRATIHVIPSANRWSGADANMEVVTNTPSLAAIREARSLAEARGYVRGREFTIYLNGWLSATRGVATLIGALKLLRERQLPVKVLVAGRPASSDAEELLALDNVENLGMLSNAEALATYFRTTVAFIYYDPALEINRLAESQKWTDCWATGTAFVSNGEVETLRRFKEVDACFTLPYHDHEGLANLIGELSADAGRIRVSQENLARMNFRYWDEHMRLVLARWFAQGSAPLDGRLFSGPTQ